MKKLHDLLVLNITQRDEERKIFPLAQIVGRAGIRWEPEFPVDKGWIDIYVPAQEKTEHPYVIEAETGYDFNCSEILRKHERFRRALTPITPSSPKLCVIIPPILLNFYLFLEPKRFLFFFGKENLNGNAKGVKKLL